MATVRGGLPDWKGNAGPLIIKLGHKGEVWGKEDGCKICFFTTERQTSHQFSPMFPRSMLDHQEKSTSKRAGRIAVPPQRSNMGQT